jgi:hypothetical protein
MLAVPKLQKQMRAGEMETVLGDEKIRRPLLFRVGAGNGSANPRVHAVPPLS